MKYSIAASLLTVPFVSYASEAHGLSVRGGLSHPLDNDTREFTSSTGYNVGLRGEFPFPGMLTSLIGSTSKVDLEGFKAKDGSDQINYLGLTYFEEVRFAALGPVTPYAGLGVGIYRVGVKAQHTVTTVTPQGSGLPIITVDTFDDSTTGICPGGRAMVGVELPWKLFVEASVVFIGEVDNFDASTANLAVGLRF